MFEFPKKLKAGDLIRVVAPSQSLAIISEDTRNIARQRFQELNLRVSFGRNIEEKDEAFSSSIESRVKDLHEAFADQAVKGIFSVIGGFNCNQLLPYLDWNLIKKNPKI
ncbi:MAG: LD-carboxypeptidase, partial [Candidatus Parcubacteria bacterium]|nr:LD-carboxypeptidase [Candidatus Parcubacteria bacterium]